MSENALNILGRKPKHQFKQRTRVLAIAQCGSVIVGGGSSDGELALTDPTQGLREVVKGHEDSVSCVLLHENRLWTGSEDKTVRVWLTTHPFTCVGVIRSFQAGIQRLAPGPGVVYVSDESSKIMAFSADPRRKFRKEGVCIGHSAPVTHLQYAEGRLWSSSLDRTFRSWDGRNRQLACVSVPVENTTVFIYHAESFFIGTNSGCIYHLNSHGKIKASLLGHKLSIRHLVYWAEKDTLFSCSRDGVVKIWMSRELVETLTFHERSVNSLLLYGSTLYSASSDKYILAWDVTDFVGKLTPEETDAVREKPIAPSANCCVVM